MTGTRYRVLVWVEGGGMYPLIVDAYDRGEAEDLALAQDNLAIKAKAYLPEELEEARYQVTVTSKNLDTYSIIVDAHDQAKAESIALAHDDQAIRAQATLLDQQQ
jgi:hypothetical protein